MKGLLKGIVRFYKEYALGKIDQRSDNWFMVDSFILPLVVLCLYLYFVLELGPRLMKHRKPFQLENVMKVYNVIQIVLNVYILERALTLAWANSKFKWVCQPIDWSMDPEAVALAQGVWVFHMIKLIDLLDTVFIVLRKKHQQISFLHLYHHAGMYYGTWGTLRYYPGGDFVLMGLINSIVHIVMYGYYFITTIDKTRKVTWWKKHLTQMQIAQFFILGVHSLAGFFVRDCATPRFHSTMVIIQNGIMCLLFSEFYYKNYIKQKLK